MDRKLTLPIDCSFIDKSEPVTTEMTSSLRKLLKYMDELRGQGRDEAA